MPYEEYASAAARANVKDVYLADRPGGTLLTAAGLEQDLLLVSTTDVPREKVRTELEAKNLKVFNGRWSERGSVEEMGLVGGDAVVVAVAYQSRESTPGLWMDAYATMPTQQIVLRAMYEEFRENDELGNVTFEEFVELSHPNVVILSPSEIATYASQKER